MGGGGCGGSHAVMEARVQPSCIRKCCTSMYEEMQCFSLRRVDGVWHDRLRMRWADEVR